MWTNLPYPCSFMMPNTAWVTKNMDFRSMSIIRSQLSRVISSMGVDPVMPATFTRMSIRPNRALAAATFAGMVSNSATLNSSARASPPLALMSAATAWAASRFISARMTLAPCSARRRALASPMPRPPPVIIAALSVNNISAVPPFQPL